ncbi:MAG: hypothetical protein U1E51_09185 [Candidatus Binatia bacterium]|nr:hypothetical protein [Candidatus Binatia bacterium]
MDIRTLVDTAKARGVVFKIDGDRIKVEARTEPDGETKALLESLRDHKDELRSVLAAPDCWNCGATMTRTKDITGKPWWACWKCAKTI